MKNAFGRECQSKVPNELLSSRKRCGNVHASVLLGHEDLALLSRSLG